jgi:hypothetical protein
MVIEATVMIPRRDVNCYEDRSSSLDAKKRCKLS